ncbi:protein FMC1 homolog [Topomyia yanbarensis]|uniref:protein FMC1 homolog n=1 Tax=Topomyia yanbarensis TaxID=2498891 RepID=UPI00273CDAB6|nr:protein FMC1 homolog [Topomyia yanbarensis]
MTSTARNAGVTLKKLLNELRKVSPEANYKESLAAKYIVSQFRKFETTEQQHCRAREEMHFTAKTYLCYLQSIRKLKEINATYSGRGERSIRDTADMVGFKLPHDPK